MVTRQDSFYYFNWHQAEDYCISHGGHLASIRSHDEEKIVLGLADKKKFNGSWEKMWIGLNSLRSPEEWEWVDGTSVFFTNYEKKPSDVDYITDRCAAIDSRAAGKNKTKLSRLIK